MRNRRRKREARNPHLVIADVVQEAGEGKVVGTGRRTELKGDLSRGVTFDLRFNDSDVRNAVMNLEGPVKEWAPTLTVEAYAPGEWEIWARNKREMVAGPIIVEAPDPASQEQYFREEMLPALEDIFSELGQWGLGLIDEAGTAPKWANRSAMDRTSGRNRDKKSAVYEPAHTTDSLKKAMARHAHRLGKFMLERFEKSFPAFDVMAYERGKAVSVGDVIVQIYTWDISGTPRVEVTFKEWGTHDVLDVKEYGAEESAGRIYSDVKGQVDMFLHT